MKRFVYATLASVLVFAALIGPASTAKAGDWGFSFGFHGPHSHFDFHHAAPVYRPPVVYAPRVHYDRVYYPEYHHWTPDLGYHSHGHYDYVPHYTPRYAHYDHYHW